MKLSHLTIGILLLGVSIVKAQNPKPFVAKQDSTKAIKKSKQDKSLDNKAKIKLSKKDSLKTKRHKREIGPDYCPPCGMG